MSNYTFRRYGSRYVVSVDNHADLMPALRSFLVDNQICAASVSGIGAVDSATLGFFDFNTKQYAEKRFEEQMELASIVGNVSMLEGGLHLHLHATLGRSDFSSLAGHLVDAHINGACELVIDPIDGELSRKRIVELGITLLDF